MRLEGKKIAVLVAEGFEDLEYWVTVMRLQEAPMVHLPSGMVESGEDSLEGRGASPAVHLAASVRHAGYWLSAGGGRTAWRVE